MTNSLSELYEAHPEYVIKPTNREPVMGRGGTQMVLDMANPKVQDLVFHVVDTLMTKYPEIDYIKWDSNAPVMNHGSQYLSAANKSNLDEFWVSDNTDAVQRVYMQWGTSHFFPAVAMASHISAAPNHQTQRVIPLKYRTDVAMSGRLGMEIQPKNMTDEEKGQCRKAIAEYKTIRPVVQQGDLYRLLSPYDGKGAASLMYVAPDKSDAVFFWWRLDNDVIPHLPGASPPRESAAAARDYGRPRPRRHLHRAGAQPHRRQASPLRGQELHRPLPHGQRPRDSRAPRRGMAQKE